MRRLVLALLLLVLAAPLARAANHTVKSGETLAQLAELHYGHRAYALVLAKLNNFPDTKVTLSEGQKVRVPDLKEMLIFEGLPTSTGPELDEIVKARYGFVRIREQLSKAVDPGNSKGKISIPSDVKQQLRASADAIETAAKSLAKKGNFSNSPVRMRQRLVKCAENLRKLANGSQEKGLEDSIHLLIAQAWVRGIMWGRNEDGDF